MTPKQIIKHFGSIGEASYRLGYTENAIRYWLRKKRVPKHARKWIASHFKLVEPEPGQKEA